MQLITCRTPRVEECHICCRSNWLRRFHSNGLVATRPQVGLSARCLRNNENRTVTAPPTLKNFIRPLLHHRHRLLCSLLYNILLSHITQNGKFTWSRQFLIWRGCDFRVRFRLDMNTNNIAAPLPFILPTTCAQTRFL